MMLMVTLLTRSAFSCGKDRNNLFGLKSKVRSHNNNFTGIYEYTFEIEEFVTA